MFRIRTKIIFKYIYLKSMAEVAFNVDISNNPSDNREF